MKLLATLASVLVVSLPLFTEAQATRTWVSGVGDDANPGSRTAPDKTFAGAITNTAPGGVIDVLDPGDFGPVTITNSITIDGDECQGDIQVSNSAPGVVIDAGPNDTVTLRNVNFEGLGVGTSAIQILSAGAVHIENCRIDGFVGSGISDANGVTDARIFVKDATIHACRTNGISLAPAAKGTVTIQNVDITACGDGIDVGTKATAVVVNSTVSRNNNVGISSSGLVQLSLSTITDNGGEGLKSIGFGAKIVSYHNNVITGNNPNGKATTGLPN